MGQLHRFLLLCFLVGVTSVALAQSVPDEWLTYYEKSGCTKTPRYQETMDYCRKLEKGSPWIKVVSFGKSPEGRDLPLVIASRSKIFDPVAARKSGKAIMLVQGGIHSGEIDGKDACLMLLRDIAVTKTKTELLDNIILLVIPIFSVDGHERFGKHNRINQDGPDEMGWRTTAQNLNLNRDHMKADAPEMQAWLRMYSAWLPDFLVDCHVTNGADYQYTVTYAIEHHLNLAEPVRNWVKGTYIPDIHQRMDAAGEPIVPYVFFLDDKQQSKGMYGGNATPRFSTGYAALQNRPALLIETHMLKLYQRRVEGTYRMVEQTMRLLNDHHTALKSAIAQADRQAAGGIADPLPLKFSVVTDVPNQTIRFKGIKSVVEKSEISGTDKIVYTGEPYEADIPRFDSITVSAAVKLPAAYLIPRQWNTVIARLGFHGVQMQELASPESIDVEVYRFSNPKWQQNPYEGRHPVTYTTTPGTERRFFPAGTIVVPANQRAARVAAHALEPDGPDAFVAWGFFDAIFEQKEYAEDYVMEKVAPQMLAADAALKREFESKLQSDTAFANSPRARLNFFYKNSPYWDKELMVYPIARVIKDVPLKTREYKER